MIVRARAAVQQGELEPRLAAASFLYYGQLCREQSNSEEAVQAWKTAQLLAPESHAGREAAAELSKIRPASK